MNDADRKAFEDWVTASGRNHMLKINKNGFYEDLTVTAWQAGWQAALEWRDSQVGEPIGHIMIDTGDFEHGTKEYHLDGNWEPVYTTPPAAQINQQLVGALEEVKEAIYNAQYVAALQNIEFALAAAKETT